ncbi:hypothetical protein LINPERPRIM_LOCUS25384 [Linum perenne]
MLPQLLLSVGFQLLFDPPFSLVTIPGLTVSLHTILCGWIRRVCVFRVTHTVILQLLFRNESLLVMFTRFRAMS